MIAQDLLIIMRTILAATVSVMDTAFWWRSECNGHVQSSDRQVTLHPVTDRPANHAPRMQVEDHGKIQPAFARPDIGDVTCPFLVWLICNEVSVQQVVGHGDEARGLPKPGNDGISAMQRTSTPGT